MEILRIHTRGYRDRFVFISERSSRKTRHYTFLYVFRICIRSMKKKKKKKSVAAVILTEKFEWKIFFFRSLVKLAHSWKHCILSDNMTNVEICDYSIFRVTIKNIRDIHYPFRITRRIFPRRHCSSRIAMVNLQNIPIKREKKNRPKLSENVYNVEGKKYFAIFYRNHDIYPYLFPIKREK